MEHPSATGTDGPSDRQLVERTRTDPRSGWAAIWDRHGPALHGYTARMLGDPADADDVVAEVFVVAATRIEGLRNPDALRAWLFAIARRLVQRRWRERARTTPVDPGGAVMRGSAHTDEADRRVDALEASELLAAAAAGLGPADQELLALTLGADLDVAAVARIVGQPTPAVSVRVSRLRDTVGRAAGALLVARHHRRDCPDLDELLAEWDGRYDPRWRKRIARHVDRCSVCDDHRAGAVGVFAAPLFLVPPAAGLRSRVLDDVVRASSSSSGVDAAPREVSAELGPWDDQGFPGVEDWPRAAGGSGIGGRRGLVAVVVCLLALGFALTMALLPGDEADVAADGGNDLAAVDDTTPRSGEPSTTTSPESIDGTTSTTVPETTTTVPVTRTPPPSTTVPEVARPTVTLELGASSLTVQCGQEVPMRAVVGSSAGRSPVQVTVAWNGPDAGSVEGAAGTVTIGPFRRANTGTGIGTTTIEVTATAVDADGRAATTVRSFTLEVFPCPG